MTDERRNDDQHDDGRAGSNPNQRSTADDEELPDTTDENDMPVDNPSG